MVKINDINQGTAKGQEGARIKARKPPILAKTHSGIVWVTCQVAMARKPAATPTLGPRTPALRLNRAITTTPPEPPEPPERH